MSEQQKPSESNSARGYPVGYGRPTAHTRFKKGESGNPNGRKKGQRNIRTVVDDTLKQRITMREGNRTRSVTKLDAVIVTMVNAAPAVPRQTGLPRC